MATRGADKIKPTMAPTISMKRLMILLTIESKGSLAMPRTGTPLMVSRCNPESRIWK